MQTNFVNEETLCLKISERKTFTSPTVGYRASVLRADCNFSAGTE
jgi:hypothetical protein